MNEKLTKYLPQTKVIALLQNLSMLLLSESERNERDAISAAALIGRIAASDAPIGDKVVAASRITACQPKENEAHLSLPPLHGDIELDPYVDVVIEPFVQRLLQGEEKAFDELAQLSSQD